MFKDIMRVMAVQMLDSVGYDHEILLMRFQIGIAFVMSPPFVLF